MKERLDRNWTYVNFMHEPSSVGAHCHAPFLDVVSLRKVLRNCQCLNNEATSVTLTINLIVSRRSCASTTPQAHSLQL